VISLLQGHHSWLCLNKAISIQSQHSLWISEHLNKTEKIHYDQFSTKIYLRFECILFGQAFNIVYTNIGKVSSAPTLPSFKALRSRTCAIVLKHSCIHCSFSAGVIRLFIWLRARGNWVNTLQYQKFCTVWVILPELSISMIWGDFKLLTGNPLKDFTFSWEFAVSFRFSWRKRAIKYNE